jgi:hypothetical protein
MGESSFLFFLSMSVDVDCLALSRSWCPFFMTGFPQTGLKVLRIPTEFCEFFVKLGLE